MRFIVISDQFNLKYKRSIEEIKQRYYAVSKLILEKRGEFSHPIVKKPYNYQYEVRRKNNLEKLFLRSPEQHLQEKKILDEVKLLDQKIKKEEKEQRNLEKLLKAQPTELGTGTDFTGLVAKKKKNLTLNTQIRSADSSPGVIYNLIF